MKTGMTAAYTIIINRYTAQNELTDNILLHVSVAQLCTSRNWYSNSVRPSDCLLHAAIVTEPINEQSARRIVAGD